MTIVQPQPGARRQFLDTPINGIWCRYVVVAQQKSQSTTVYIRSECRVGTQRLQLGSEQQGIVLPAVVQWLLAEPVTRQPQRFFATIPERKGKHAYAPRQRCFHAPGFYGSEQDFRI